MTEENWDPLGVRSRCALCLRCGRHEMAGSFCTYCLTAEYDLADHPRHGPPCPLGWYPDPVGAHKVTTKYVLPATFGEGVNIRHHPRTAGYAADTDPPLPPWIVAVRVRTRSSGTLRPEVAL